MPNTLSIKLLYTTLGDEMLAWYQYWTCANLAQGDGRSDALPEFTEHAKEEMEHADKVMQRLKELGCQPPNDPCDWKGLANPWTKVESPVVLDELRITADAESAAIRFYSNCVRVLENTDDITTTELFKELLADEQKHLYDLNQLIREF